MKEKFEQLLYMIKKFDATDVHFIVDQHFVKVTIRGSDGLQDISCAAFDVTLFNYLRYISNLDLGNAAYPQSGNFTYMFQKVPLYFRFSTITTLDKQTGVLRILNNHPSITLFDLSESKANLSSFQSWTMVRSGLVVLSGPTGSGKSTTLHAILHQIALEQKFRVVSLEDPIEIFDDSYLQLQINERNHFSYEEGIKELMRHDPDVIMIGEIRDPNSAKMLMRSALSGHMIFTTVHASSCVEAIRRLQEFGLKNDDLRHTLTAVSSQRLYQHKTRKERVCLYEILEKEDLRYYFAHQDLPKHYRLLQHVITDAIEKNRISHKEAQKDLIFERI